VDGFFWTAATDGTLHLLLAVGIREGRPGLAVVPVAEAPLSEAASWLAARVRAEGEDFRTTLPGGELEGLYSLTAAGEALKLAARLFAYEHAVPAAVEKHMPPSDGHDGAERHAEGEGADGGPEPSRLPYRKVVLRA
jgi:hypothetical protein